MIQPRVLAAIAVLAVTTASAQAETARGWKLQTAVDIYAPGNQEKHNRDAIADACDGVGRGCSAKAETGGGGGARVGLRRHGRAWNYGGSVGYMAGGPNQGRFLVSSGFGDLDLRNTNQTLRALAEAGKTWELSRNWSASLGAGVGWAASFERQSCSQTGFLTVIDICSAMGPRSSERGWATWEVSPTMHYKSAEFGLRYVGFARGRFLPWNTVAFTAGYKF
ncbi:MAG: hypothetical protein HY553_01330 [Elusimicrobia bacterium]|nr:hypothetical protein [Elusimicrobiota bacterium]